MSLPALVQILRLVRVRLPIEEVWLLLMAVRAALKTLVWVGLGVAIIVYVMGILGIILIRDQNTVNGEV